VITKKLRTVARTLRVLDMPNNAKTCASAASNIAQLLGALRTIIDYSNDPYVIQVARHAIALATPTEPGSEEVGR
jgi:hypothetical protein